MTGLVFQFLLFALFVGLFFRECRLDRKRALRRDKEGDLHVLEEMRKFVQSRGGPTLIYDEAIKELRKELGL